MPKGLFWGLGRGAFLGVGDKSVEARVAVEGLKTGVLFHAECSGWKQPVVECLSQKRECLSAISPARCDNTEAVGAGSRRRMLRPQDTALSVERFPLQLLRFGVVAFVPKSLSQTVHRQ